ncbi:MAG TPA: DUF2231 domain-containing protein [Rubricoccaceae bacterium]|jgi:uncharacterized membrane protein|nr:DUF2231 domain-containing protein [Rubricoccaceae bacterium]
MGIEEALQYEIPYLHPLAVHFPLVLLMLAAGAATAYAVLGTAVWRRTVLALLVLAVPAAYWAHRTGEALEDAVEGEPSVERFVEYHEAAATWTLRAGVVALLAAAGGTLWWRQRLKRRVLADPGGVLPKEPLGLRLVLLVPALTAAFLVAYTAHLGGLMVWGVPR